MTKKIVFKSNQYRKESNPHIRRGKAKTIQEMIDALSDEVKLLTQLRDRGATLLDAQENHEGYYAAFQTTELQVAKDFSHLDWLVYEEGFAPYGLYVLLPETWKKKPNEEE